jgi:hypothetical protein
MIRDKVFGLDWYHWIALVVITIPVLLYLELKYIYPREVTLGFEVNKLIQQEFKEIKELIRDKK